MIPCVEVTASVAGAPQTRGASLIAMFLGLRNTVNLMLHVFANIAI